MKYKIEIEVPVKPMEMKLFYKAKWWHRWTPFAKSRIEGLSDPAIKDWQTKYQIPDSRVFYKVPRSWIFEMYGR